MAACRGDLKLHFPFGHEFRAEWLPLYAPDLNPDEFVWQHAKTNGVVKKPLTKNESLRQRVESDLENIKSQPKLVRSLFFSRQVSSMLGTNW